MSTITITTTMPRVAARPTILRRVPLALWNSLFIAIVIVLGAWYLVTVNKIVGYGYQIKDAERRVLELRTEVRRNQITLGEIEAVGNLTAEAAILGLVPVGQVEYVTKSKTGVALR